jgi:predicted transcriptional regulator
MTRADSSSSGTPRAAPRPVLLGRLEALVMECLWKSEGAVSVREVTARLNGRWAYTTLMTTLDRLFKKNLASREPKGRAFVYRARLTRIDIGVQALRTAVSDIGAGADTRELALAALVEALESHDPQMLDSLDRLVREKRKALRQARLSGEDR